MAIDDTVNGIITDARGYSEQAFDDALQLTEDAVREADASVTISPPTFKGINTQYSFGNVSDPGSFLAQFVRPTGEVQRPTFEPIYVPQLPDIDDAPAALDTSNLFDVARPSFVIPEFSDQAPVVNTAFSFPDSPDLVFPDAPNQQQIDVPDAPDVTLPKFDREFEGNEVVIPSDLGGGFEQAVRERTPETIAAIEGYVSAWVSRNCPGYHDALAKLEAKLSEGMDGGTAISNEIEQSIYDRARYRAEQEALQAENEIISRVSLMGFSTPPGVLNEITTQVRVQLAMRIIDSTATVAIERAKLENQHAQFVIQTSAQMRQVMLNGMLQYADTLLRVNSESLQYAKQLNDYALQVYNLSLEKFKVDLEVYQTHARIYEVQLKSALADLEAYTVEIEAAKLRKDIEQYDLDAYVKKIEAQQVKVQAYSSQLEAVRIEADTRRLQIQLYGEKVRAHALLVQAKNSEFGAYKAALDGDTAKIQAYSEEVNAYRSKVQAFQARAAVEEAKARTSLETNRNIAAIYEQDIRKYISDVEVEKAIFSGELSEYQAHIEKYKTDLAAEVDKLNAKLDISRFELEANRTEYDGDLRVALERANLRRDLIRLRADTAVAASGVLQSVASAALNSQNTMVQLVAEETI